MLKQLVLTGISLTLLSCSSDTEEINGAYNSTPGSLKMESIIDYNRLFSPIVQKSTFQSRTANNDIVVEDELVVVYGCDRYEVKKKAKVALDRVSAAKFGVEPGIYIVEYVLCYKNVHKPGYDVWAEDSEKCGYKPSGDFVLGNKNIAITKKRGYQEPESNAKELRTFLLHLVSDLSGRRLNKYDPCPPNDIEWIYSISKQE